MTAHADREAAMREQLLAAFEQVCPNVVGNPFIPHWPLPAQALFLGLHQTAPQDRVFQAMYGGAAGGGKSDALLMACAQYAWKHPQFAAAVFRKTYTDLAEPGAIMDRAIEWWGASPRCHWDGTNKVMRFDGGAKVSFNYLKNPNDHLRYQGAEFQLTCWDELTQWPEARPYEYVGISRVRKTNDNPVPLRTLSATNPGGPGHRWVMGKFVGGQDPVTGERLVPEHPYIPAFIQDNHHLNREQYIEGLMMLHPTLREQLLRGDWTAREPGDYFRAEWFGPLLSYEDDLWPSADCVRIRWWDLAASEKDDAAFTSGVRMARHRNGCRAIEHCRSFRATPGKRDGLIVQTAQADGHGVVVGLEVEPGSGGIAQVESLAKTLRAQGFKVVWARPQAHPGKGAPLTDAERAVMSRQPVAQGGKAGRADPVASCLQRGYDRRGEGPDNGMPWWGADAGRVLDEQQDGLRLFAGPWTQAYLDVVEGFPDGATCDEVDATSGAWAWLEAHPFGLRTPASEQKKTEPAEPHNLHPSERPARAGPEKDRGGRWRA